MAEDLQGRLHWLEEELKAQEPEAAWTEDAGDGLGPGHNYAQDFDRTMYQDVDYRVDPEKPRKKSAKGLVLLAILEILGILAVIGWWMQWLA